MSKIQYESVDAYIAALPEERRAAIEQLRQVILDHLPKGFEEAINYNMIGYVVPHSRYPAGYHCAPNLPLPFINVASQKSHIALYHMGLYAHPELMDWFTKSYETQAPTKLNMGKSCVRFKKPAHIPFELIGELVSRMTVQEWIDLYEHQIKK